MSDPDTIRERHHVIATLTSDPPIRVCHGCLERWPCDTRVVLDALDERWRQEQEWMNLALGAASERDAARADADRLAEALRGFVGERAPGGHGDYVAARDALRQHEEEKT